MGSTSETVKVPCPACGKTLMAPANRAGMKVRCPCGQESTIPSPDGAKQEISGVAAPAATRVEREKKTGWFKRNWAAPGATGKAKVIGVGCGGSAILLIAGLIFLGILLSVLGIETNTTPSDATPSPAGLEAIKAAFDAITVPEVIPATAEIPKELQDQIDAEKMNMSKRMEAFLADKPDEWKSLGGHGSKVTKADYRSALDRFVAGDLKGEYKLRQAGIDTRVCKQLLTQAQRSMVAAEAITESRSRYVDTLKKSHKDLRDHISKLPRIMDDTAEPRLPALGLLHDLNDTLAELTRYCNLETMTVTQHTARNTGLSAEEFSAKVREGLDAKPAKKMLAVAGMIQTQVQARQEADKAQAEAEKKAVHEAVRKGPGGQTYRKAYALGKKRRHKLLGKAAILKYEEDVACDTGMQLAEKAGVPEDLRQMFMFGYQAGVRGFPSEY